MKSLILAGGFGTRLRPLTINVPKPMAPVANKPMLEHVTHLCVKHGSQDLLFMLHYSPDMIRRYFESGKNFGARISYLRPDVDLGTAGCARFAADTEEHSYLRNEPFMVLSGDVLTDFNLEEAQRFHKEKNAAVTIVLTRTKNPLPYGVVIANEEGRIIRFLEKPSWGEVFSDTINTGIYIISPEALKHIPAGQSFDFSKNLFPLLMEKGIPIFGYVAEGYWKDVGNLTEYRTAHIDILEGRVNVEPYGQPLEKAANVRTGENCKIAEDVQFEGEVRLGKNVQVGPGVKITQSVIGDNVLIGSGATIRRSVVWDRVIIGPEAQLRETILGRSVRVGQRARLEVGSVIANRCDIGSGAVIKPSVKMWPQKSLEEGAVLSSSLVWGDRWSRQLFGNEGISGLANLEVTPEFAAKLGAAYGAHLGVGSYVITSRDAHKSSRLIKRAFISGLLSSGVEVGDLRMVPVPVLRYELGKEGEAGGVHIRMAPKDPPEINIQIFDSDGNFLGPSKEKAIEQLFMREDFKRAGPSDVGELSVPPQALEYYRSGFLKNINAKAIRERRFKVVIDYAHSPAAQILPDLLGLLGVDTVAINANTSFNHPTKNEEEMGDALKQLAGMVKTLGADAGFLMNNGAEKLFIVDENGEPFSPEESLFLAGLLTNLSGAADVISYPVNCSSALEKAVAQRGVTTMRSPVNRRHLLDYAKKPNMGLVLDGEGGFVFPKFHHGFDAMYSLAKFLEMIATQNTTFGDVRKNIPKDMHVFHRRVPCSWGSKGEVMRRAQTAAQDARLELIDGVKIHFNDGWVLALPDASEAYCHIWAEANTEEKALSYLDEYDRLVDEWQSASSKENESWSDWDEESEKNPEMERERTTENKAEGGKV